MTTPFWAYVTVAVALFVALVLYDRFGYRRKYLNLVRDHLVMGEEFDRYVKSNRAAMALVKGQLDQLKTMQDDNKALLDRLVGLKGGPR